MAKFYEELRLELVLMTDDVVRTSTATTQEDCFGEGTKPNGWEGEQW